MEIAVIQSRIYEIRGFRVMLDFDLAEMYGVETRVLNQAVKRNVERFPEDFMFQLTKDGWTSLRSQIVTLEKGQGKHPKYLPHVFTELGVAMLSSVLNSPAAIQINIKIMRAFVAMRRLALNTPADRIAEFQDEVGRLKTYVEEAFADQNDINGDTRVQLELISETLAEMQSVNRGQNKPRNPIGFKRETELSAK